MRWALDGLRDPGVGDGGPDGGSSSSGESVWILKLLVRVN